MKSRKKLRPFVVGMDSEDDGNGNPFLWCFTHGEGKWFTRRQVDALQYLATLAEKKRERGFRVECWATNLEYDLCNLFPRDRIVEVSLRFGRSALVGARWRGVDFRDTVRHVPVSVEQWGEMLGFKKREGKLFHGTRPSTEREFRRYLVRCERDSAITYRAAKRLHQAFAPFKEVPRLTLASTALRIWEKHHWKREVQRPAMEVFDAAFSAYHGGRTQAFVAGSFTDVRVIDVASMFPWAMVSGDLPLPWGFYSRCGRGAAVSARGIYRVRVRSELSRPRLPVRTDAGTIYPNGTWTGWYVGEELLGFIRAGGRATVLEGFEFLESCRPFRSYVTTLFKKKQRARGVARLMYKLLLNSLYGKFGQQGRTVRAVPLAQFLQMPTAPLTWREWNGLAIFTHEGTPPPWANMVWCAFVTARARNRLADEMQAIETSGGRPLYCDTDSVMYQGGTRRYPAKAKLGAFELRGTFRSMLVIGKKEYALERRKGQWESAAKGVPFAERMRYLREGVADFDRPMKIREASRLGVQVNVWRRIRKVRHVSLIAAASPVDGALPVPWIVQARKRKSTRKG